MVACPSRWGRGLADTRCPAKNGIKGRRHFGLSKRVRKHERIFPLSCAGEQMKLGTPLQRHRLLIAGVFTVLVLILTHIPQNYVTEKMALTNADKIVHTIAYGLMAVLLAGVFKMPLTLRKLFVLLVILCALGYVDEYTQQWVGRPFSIRDWLADIAGISLALAAYFVARRLKSKSSLASGHTQLSDSLH